MHVRSERPEDTDAIRALVSDAFGRGDEARLIDTLRRDGDLTHSLVAEIDGAVVGHAALSRLVSPMQSVALAPVAVAPRWQRRGIGSALVSEALRQAAARGIALVFVLGDPDFYARFGFSAQSAEGYASDFAGPYFMARRLSAEVSSPANAPVIYAPAFAALG